MTWDLDGSEVDAARAWLAAQGIRSGMRVAFGASPSPWAAGLLVAAWQDGIPLVLFHGRLTPREVAALWPRARAVAAVAGPGHPLAAVPGALVLPQDAPVAPRAEVLPARGALDPDATALVLFTSGTTGIPKAARLSRRALEASIAAACERLCLRATDRCLACLPLDHIGGVMLMLRAAACGASVRLLPRWDTEAAAQALTGCTVASLVPTQLHRLVARKRPFPPSVRLLLTGGGPLDPALAEAARALGCAPTQTYGLTETASMATCETVPSGLTAGSPVVGELRLAADGGIEVRGPHLFDGYEDEEGGLRPPCDAEGWYATGDAGRLDDEGRLIVLGRRTDLIVSGGENLYPAEIELLLERHPAIQEARVRGEADDEWGQVPVVDVVAPGLTADQWLEALAEVPSYKRPRRYRLVAALPRTSTGKLQRG